MTTYLPPELLGDVGEAIRARAESRRSLTVVAEGRSHALLGMDGKGFSILAEEAPQLRGLVDLYEGSVHVARALVVASEELAGAMRYEYKRATAPADAPAADFARIVEGPAGYISAV